MPRIASGLRFSIAAAAWCGAAGATPAVTILHTFQGTPDGAVPVSGVIVGLGGALFGTATEGGSANAGTVFTLKPPTRAKPEWRFKLLHNFGGRGDGRDPVGGLVANSAFALFGTTKEGGSHSDSSGTVFEMMPPTAPSRHWTKTILYDFLGRIEQEGNNTVDGDNPTGKLLIDASGALYGSTTDGGTPNSGEGISYNGTWWKLSPPAGGQTAWTETILGYPGQDPRGGLIADSAGRLYGTSVYGNISDGLLLFSVGTPSWVVEADYMKNGQNPSDPVLDASGNLYCAAEDGPTEYGLILELPVTGGGSTPASKVVQIYNFAGGADGAQPLGPLVVGPSGSFYGTTSAGGANGFGTIFQLSPPATGQTTWTHTVLYSFDGAAATPSGPLTPGLGGVFYGTTMASSAAGTSGTVYQFTP